MNERDHENNPVNDDELLRRIMPELGMDPSAPTGRYRNRARRRYLLTRIAIVCAVAAVLAAAALILLLPARFLDVQTEETPSAATLRFRLDRVALLESVTAQLDGRPLDLTMTEPGCYELTVPVNGQVTFTARTFTGRESQLALTVSCVDQDAPHLDHDYRLGQYCYIFLTDGPDGSGLDWDSLAVTYADSGETYPDAAHNSALGYVRVKLTDASLRIAIRDHNANPLSLRLDPAGDAD